MKSMGAIRALFVLAGLYDGILGLAFALAAPQLFAHYGVTPPNHFGYVRFPGLLLLIFAAMFFAVAWRPAANRNLIPYGILLKVAYCATVFYYWSHGGIPSMWKPWAWADLAFLILFLRAYVVLSPESTQASAEQAQDVGGI